MKIDNQQLYSLTEQQQQLILSGILGDGCLTTPQTLGSNSYYLTNCKYEEYIDYKISILNDLFKNKRLQISNGYANTPIYIARSKSDSIFTKYKSLSIKSILDKLDEFGIALWFYDDGSLHKHKLFYNLNTHAFSKEIQEKYFIPFFNKHNIYPKLTKEVKKDGRVFYYLRISKFEGSFEITSILNKYKIDCYSYKLWSSETIQKWSKLQVELKRQGIVASNKRTSSLLKILNEEGTMQDIVQSLEKSKAGLIPA